MQSSIVANSCKTMAQRKRGRYCMVDVKSLKSKYGAALGKQLRDEKNNGGDQESRRSDCILDASPRHCQ